MNIPPDWYRAGARCQQTGGSRRHGTIVRDLWSGYVPVEWDTGTYEDAVHISEIRPECPS